MINYEEKLARLGKKYDSMKREADTKKGALLNTVDNMKAEHGIATAEEAKTMITELEAKVTGWEKERDDLIYKIDTAINGGGSSGRREDGPLPAGIDSLEDKYGDDSFETADDDEFEDFESN